MYRAFFKFGPKIQYSSTGSFGGSLQPTYADLMTATDGAGEARGYLANEENFQFMKDLETRNLLVPVVGNFGGPKAIRAVGKYLKDRKGATVSAFYLSNVEQYLRQDGIWGNFCANVATLPLDETSTFIRPARQHVAQTVRLRRGPRSRCCPTPLTPRFPPSRLSLASWATYPARSKYAFPAPWIPMPLLLLLFVGSGCAALIYEIVWFQLLQLVIGSSAVSLGVLLGTFMGGMCLGSLLLPRVDLGAASSAARLRRARARHRRHRPADPVGHAARRRRLHGVGRSRRRRALRPRHRRGHLPAAADAAHGRDAARRRARWVETTPEGRVVAGIFLRRQHRRRRHRKPARRLLSAARLRHGGRDLSSPSR